jgi:hypothetical protein
MRRYTFGGLVLVGLVFTFAVGSYAVAGRNDGGGFQAQLIGYSEVPSVSTPARGTFAADIRGQGNAATIDYVLSYRHIDGGAAFASHIHLGQRHTNGGVSAFLCGGGDKPACPATEGTVRGTIDAADIIGPNAQGIEPGSMAELVQAIRAGATYANVHSNPRWPGGEIRGQIRDDDDDDDDDD